MCKVTKKYWTFDDYYMQNFMVVYIFLLSTFFVMNAIFICLLLVPQQIYLIKIPSMESLFTKLSLLSQEAAVTLVYMFVLYWFVCFQTSCPHLINKNVTRIKLKELPINSIDFLKKFFRNKSEELLSRWTNVMRLRWWDR